MKLKTEKQEALVTPALEEDQTTRTRKPPGAMPLPEQRKHAALGTGLLGAQFVPGAASEARRRRGYRASIGTLV